MSINVILSTQCSCWYFSSATGQFFFLFFLVFWCCFLPLFNVLLAAFHLMYHNIPSLLPCCMMSLMVVLKKINRLTFFSTASSFKSGSHNVYNHFNFDFVSFPFHHSLLTAYLGWATTLCVHCYASFPHTDSYYSLPLANWLFSKEEGFIHFINYCWKLGIGNQMEFKL